MLFENQVSSDIIGIELNKKIKEEYGSVKKYADYTQQSPQTIYNWSIEPERLPYLTDFVVHCRLLGISSDYLCSIPPFQSKEYDELSEDGNCNSKDLPQTVGYIPPIHFEDIIILLPFFDINDIELLCRFMDNSKSDYIQINIHRKLEKIQTTTAGKYAIFMLKEKYSPLTWHFNDNDLSVDANYCEFCRNEYNTLRKKKQKWLRDCFSAFSRFQDLLNVEASTKGTD